MGVQIQYASVPLIPSFYEALSKVAKEKIYIEMITAPPLEKVQAFQEGLIAKNGPVYYAVEANRVVGWCDVFPFDNPRQSHRGGLGMALLPEYRNKGLGSILLSNVLIHAKKFGLEKVELHVYTSNIPAIALYKKHGFEQEGLIKKYRRVDDQDFDCLAMAKFF